MKKILQLITGGLVKDIGDVIDKVTTTDEERLAAKQKIQELLEKADNDAQTQVTERWKLDMQSDSFLSKNIRPLVMVFLTAMFTLLAFTDGNIGQFFNTEGIYSYISNAPRYCLRCVLCGKNLGKK